MKFIPWFPEDVERYFVNHHDTYKTLFGTMITEDQFEKIKKEFASFRAFIGLIEKLNKRDLTYSERFSDVITMVLKGASLEDLDLLYALAQTYGLVYCKYNNIAYAVPVYPRFPLVDLLGSTIFIAIDANVDMFIDLYKAGKIKCIQCYDKYPLNELRRYTVTFQLFLDKVVRYNLGENSFEIL